MMQCLISRTALTLGHNSMNICVANAIFALMESASNPLLPVVARKVEYQEVILFIDGYPKILQHRTCFYTLSAPEMHQTQHHRQIDSKPPAEQEKLSLKSNCPSSLIWRGHLDIPSIGTFS